MSEQQADDDVQETRTSACPHPEAVGKRWGDPIDEELQLDLQNYLDHWAELGPGEREGMLGPFQKVHLSGADVFWFAKRVRNEQGDVPDLHLEGASLAEVHLEGADLRFAHLEGVVLSAAHLEGANLHGAHLEGAALSWAYLEGANLGAAHLEGVKLSAAHMKGASFSAAHLNGASLIFAHLEGAAFRAVHLEGAALNAAHLEGADLSLAHLEGANLGTTWLDNKTVLTNAILDTTTCLRDIQWSGVGAVNLTGLDWRRVSRLGDETVLNSDASAEDFETAVRAYRQVAVQVRAQGLSEVADRFLYRAQVVQRFVLRKQRKFGGYLFSLLLALLAGYGYRLGRILIAYALIVIVFAAAFFASDVLSGQTPLTVQHAFDALQISLNAVHGRVFFAQFHLDTLQSWLATAESIVGIVIEGVFVAMLIQRFFAR
jgi:uncharacterized protein YjbI with pentapeptide repeats